jgi:hypothetical protein
MSKIPIRSRIPIEAWTVALLVTLFSLATSAINPATDAETPSMAHAKLLPDANPIATSAIQ